MSYGKSYFSYNKNETEAVLNSSNYVDMFGRVMVVLQLVDNYSNEIYVPLSELKKSGFELFQAGSLPKPGLSAHLTEIQLQHFEYYMKMKAMKFLSNCQKQLPQEKIDELINKEKQHFNLGNTRVVAEGNKKDLKITTFVNSPTQNPRETPPKWQGNSEYNSNANQTAKTNWAPNINQNTSKRHGNFNSSEYGNNENQSPRINWDNENIQTQPKKQGRYNNSEYKSEGSRFNFKPSPNNETKRNTNDDRKFQQSNSFGGPQRHNRSNSSNFNLSNNYTTESENKKPQSYNSFQKEEQTNIKQKYPNYNGGQSNRKVENQLDKQTHENKVNPNTGLRKPESSSTVARELRQEKIPSLISRKPVSSSTVATELMPEKTAALISHKPESSSTVATELMPEKIPPLLSVIPSIEVRNSESHVGTKNLKMKTPEEKYCQYETPRKNITEEIADSGLFEYTTLVNDSTIVGYALPASKLALELLSLLEEISTDCKTDPNFSPTPGDTVAVLKDETFARGVITDIKDKQYVCALIDFGTFITSETVCPLPKKYMDIPEFACSCKGNKDDLQSIMKLGKEIPLSINKPKELTLILVDDGKQCLLKGDSWNFDIKIEVPDKVIVAKPVFKLKPVKNIPKQNDLVIIASYFENELQLRTRECHNLLKEITYELASFEDVPVDKPELNQLVVCSCTPTLKYRAVIVAIQDRQITVKHVDYGNTHVVALDKLEMISEKLANYDNSLIPMILCGYSKKQFERESINFLSNCISKREKFVIDFKEATNMFDLLSSADKISMSEKLLNLDAPPVIQAEKSQNVDTVKLGDLKPSELKSGVNTVLCSYNGELKDGYVTFCLATEEIFNLVDAITVKVENHVKQDNNPYSPDINEAVLANFEGTWYRAVVVDKSNDDYGVFYFDYGNSGRVTSKSIRKITKEIASYQCLSAVCKLEGVLDGKTVKEPLLSRLIADIKENDVYDIEVHEKIDCAYNVTIPSLYSKWSQENLLSFDNF